jgi:hypothetical protein
VGGRSPAVYILRCFSRRSCIWHSPPDRCFPARRNVSMDDPGAPLGIGLGGFVVNSAGKWPGCDATSNIGEADSSSSTGFSTWLRQPANPRLSCANLSQRAETPPRTTLVRHFCHCFVFVADFSWDGAWMGRAAAQRGSGPSRRWRICEKRRRFAVTGNRPEDRESRARTQVASRNESERTETCQTEAGRRAKAGLRAGAAFLRLFGVVGA